MLTLTALGTSALTASYNEIVGYDVVNAGSPWNGYKVYLSSPRHSNSGFRGECGWEENINGRHWNWYAGFVKSNSDSLINRGYSVTVGQNQRDDGYLHNVTASNNWGAHVHIVTHTNAPQGGSCGSSASYVLVMYRSGNSNSVALKNELLSRLDPALPGGQNNWNCDGLAECNVSAAHKAYVELFFHTNVAAKDWFQAGGGAGTGVNESYRYGWAVDNRLGWPR